MAAFVAGLAAWTFVEYVIHAWLSHRFQTFATPFHQGHHRDPHNVFAIRTWLPLILIWITACALWGFATGVIFFTGVLSGFAIYEWLHYRIHFVLPRSRWEAWLRTRHLIHHAQTDGRGFGVTSSVWDRVFGTDLADRDLQRFGATAAATPPLDGRTNVRKILCLYLAPSPVRSN
ncbi:MAG: sterol desaturase family protein [Candidatus Binataceae bacterium]